MSHLERGGRVTPTTRIGGGGEAEIYAIGEDASLAFKRYTQPTADRRDKIMVMTRNRPDDPTASQGHVSLAWPVAAVLSDRGAFEGFVMPRIDSSAATQMIALYNPQTRHKVAPAFTWRYLLRTAMNLASALASLHQRGYVIGDVNESNILVTSSALVTLVDCDSMQVRAADDRVFRCTVGKPEYTAPELVSKDLATTDRTPASDDFGLAVLVYQLLMEGVHPFTGVWNGRGDPPPLGDRIRRGLFAAAGDSSLAPPRMSLPFTTLPDQLQELFRKAFDAGAGPSARPTAVEWRGALEQVEGDLRQCGSSPHHLYGGHLGSCPWCQRIAAALPDPFPGPSAQNPLPPIPMSPTASPTVVRPSPPRPSPTMPATWQSSFPPQAVPRATRSRRRSPWILAALLTCLVVGVSVLRTASGSDLPTPSRTVGTAQLPVTPTSSGKKTTQSVPPTSRPASDSSASALVRDYFQAINDNDYQTAYDLLGSYFHRRQSYSDFAAGFAETAHDDIEIASVVPSGPGRYDVAVRLAARQTDGSLLRFAGTYVVGPEAGTLKIVTARVRKA